MLPLVKNDHLLSVTQIEVTDQQREVTKLVIGIKCEAGESVRVNTEKLNVSQVSIKCSKIILDMLHR